MRKSTITRTWIAGVIVLAGGLVVGGIGIGLMLAYGGTFNQAASGNSYDFVPRLDGFFWTMVGLIIAGFAVALVGGILQLVAWIGALINTYPLQDKTWFVVLLAGGLIGLAFSLVAFAVMVAYVIAGPDGMALRQPQIPPSLPPQSTSLAPMS
ncbi:MAG: hypothetical protein ACHQ4H_14315 [Ktedonobacterales bacterium]